MKDNILKLMGHNESSDKKKTHKLQKKEVYWNQLCKACLEQIH